MGSGRSVRIGGVQFGDGAPVRVESMLKSRLDDTESCLKELAELREAGCELVRVAFPSEDLAPSLTELVSRAEVPLMADIHFNHKLALTAMECGCGSIRINPGNMSGAEGLMSVLDAAKSNGVVIRIGANGGSLSGRQLDACGGDRALALVLAVEEQLVPLLKRGFEEVIISAKSSSVNETVLANTILSQRYPYPLHIGITEAGAGMDGAVKSAAGLGILLSQGIGDTMRVSLTGDSRTEVDVAYMIQRSIGTRKRGVNIISCPGCGRRRVDVANLERRTREILSGVGNLPDGLDVAVMGCEVNGPKEAASADIGIAGTQNGFVMFKKGVAIETGGIEALDRALAVRLKELSTA
ncbi:MAG: flavodoxin-dependent (E)-4-hydroxy-3-methylbut-2-enyl-diphosphate synthase [Synergistaceae bacterium]|jgi:(E)-4-hydroxy-3-methylbut-2-enyl-diphosphate synthase|nr:flavodoxin-dependent (E)-4-hydroxy-3-methylbut-2-enyl-diphosphate synthase [Synergistaceae bacterium]